MDWLNYHHLLYFWTVARHGSVTRASRELHLSQSTVSGQIRQLESAIGSALFQRVGRTLQLTETGRLVQHYADEIFATGRELVEVVRGRPTGRPVRLVVGIAEVIPKLVAFRLLEPALGLAERTRIVCREGSAEALLAELALHKLDLVLTDAPVSPGLGVRAFSHLLGECGVSFFATPPLAAGLARSFPRSLERQPILLPVEGTSLRNALDQWFDATGVRPEIAGEFSDSALLKVFGQASAGVFPAPTVIEREVKRQYGVRVVGRVEDVRERFYAISPERRLKHPAVVAVSEAARTRVFA